MLNSLVIAFSTYSRIPMPHMEWNEKGMRYSMCFFPLVGAVTGLCCLGAFYLCRRLGMGQTATAAILAVLPVLISGGIHMDGFLDTMDAKSSWKSAEEKLRILKDPHTGAFAIIYGGVYLMLLFAFFCEVTEAEIFFVAAGYVYSRILSALSVVFFRKAKKDGMLADTASFAPKSVKVILGAELVCFAAAALFFSPVQGIVLLLAGAAAFLHYRLMSYRVFGGTTGDLAGYFLQVCELLILLALVLAGKLF